VHRIVPVCILETLRTHIHMHTHTHAHAHVQDDLVRWQNKILAAKTGADTAAVKAKLYQEKTDE